MNSIYDFNEIQEISAMQKKLIWHYVVYSMCFLTVLVLACIYIDNNILLTTLFALALLSFILFSIVFWKIKYGILKEYKEFLDKLETGNPLSYVGIFERKSSQCNDSDEFDTYIFTYSNKEMEFLIHNKYSVNFVKGEKYRIECVGNYVCQWEIVE